MNDDAKKALINYDGPVKSPKVPVLSFRPKGEISFFQHIMRPLSSLEVTVWDFLRVHQI